MKIFHRIADTTQQLTMTNDFNLVRSTKFLGVYLDETPSWKTHTYHLTKELARMLFFGSFEEISEHTCNKGSISGSFQSWLLYGIMFHQIRRIANKILIMQKRGMRIRNYCTLFFVLTLFPFYTVVSFSNEVYYYQKTISTVFPKSASFLIKF